MAAASVQQNVGDISCEILALFDDPSALSQLENILLNSELYNMYNMEQYQMAPMIKISEETKNDNECPNNETNTKPKMDEVPFVFAVPIIYNCMYCVKGFYNQTARRRHQRNHIKKQLICSHCGYRSYGFGSLQRHYMYYHDHQRKRFIDIMPRME